MQACIPEHQRLQESSDDEEAEIASPSAPSEEASSIEYHDPDPPTQQDRPTYSRPASAPGSRQISPDPQLHADLLQQIHAAGLQHADLLRQLHASGLQQATGSGDPHHAMRAAARARRSLSTGDQLFTADAVLTGQRSLPPPRTGQGQPLEYSWQHQGSHLRKQSSLPTTPAPRSRYRLVSTAPHISRLNAHMGAYWLTPWVWVQEKRWAAQISLRRGRPGPGPRFLPQPHSALTPEQ